MYNVYSFCSQRPLFIAVYVAACDPDEAFDIVEQFLLEEDITLAFTGVSVYHMFNLSSSVKGIQSAHISENAYVI